MLARDRISAGVGLTGAVVGVVLTIELAMLLSGDSGPSGIGFAALLFMVTPAQVLPLAGLLAFRDDREDRSPRAGALWWIWLVLAVLALVAGIWAAYVCQSCLFMLVNGARRCA